MHSPKDLVELPLRYETHLTNNINTAVQNSICIQKGLENYTQSIEDFSQLWCTHRNLSKRLALNDFPRLFQNMKSSCSSLGKVHEMFTAQSNLCDSFTAGVVGNMNSRLRPNTKRLVHNCKEITKEIQRLERRKEECYAAVDKSKSKYWRKSIAHREIDEMAKVGTDDPALKAKMQAAGKDMKDAAASYSESVEKCMQFLEVYNKKGPELLGQFEANDRCILDIARESVHSWLKQYAEFMSAAAGEAQKVLSALDEEWSSSSDISNFIEMAHSEPSSDPQQIYKFQLYDPNLPLPEGEAGGAATWCASASAALDSGLAKINKASNWFTGKKQAPQAAKPAAQAEAPPGPTDDELANAQVHCTKFCVEVLRLKPNDPSPTPQHMEKIDAQLTQVTKVVRTAWGRRVFGAALGNTLQGKAEEQKSEGGDKSDGRAVVVSGVAYMLLKQVLTRTFDEAADGSDTQLGTVLLTMATHVFTPENGGFIQEFSPRRAPNKPSAVVLTSPTEGATEGEGEPEEEPAVNLMAPPSDAPHTRPCTLAYDVRDQPFILEWKFWEEYFFGLVVPERSPCPTDGPDCGAPLLEQLSGYGSIMEMTPAQWRIAIQSARDRFGKEATPEGKSREQCIATLCGMLQRMDYIGADQRLIRQMSSLLHTTCHLSEDEVRERVAALLPNLRWQ